MAWHETWLHTDLAKPINVEPLRGVMFSQDNMANKIGVKVTYNGEAAELSGTIVGSVIRDDGQTVTWPGYVDGNEAYIVLPESAYAVVGRISIVIRLIDATTNMKTTLAAAMAYVQRTSTGAYIDPGNVVPNLETLLAKIEACNNAAIAANGATVAAYNAVATIENLRPTVYTEELTDGHYKIVIEDAPVSRGANKPRKILLIGDSYATVWTTAFQFTPWPVTVKSYVEAADADSTVIYKGRSGCAFGVPTNSPYAFCNIFTTQPSVRPDGTPFNDPGVDFGTIDPEDITDIYVFAGRNDFMVSLYNDIEHRNLVLNGISAFITACRAACEGGSPKIHIGVIGGIGTGCCIGYEPAENRYWHITPAVENGSTSSAVYTVHDPVDARDFLFHNGVLCRVIAPIAIGDTFVFGTNIVDSGILDMKEVARLNTVDWYGECTRLGAISISNCDSILRDTEYMYADGTHPGSGGQNELARYIANVVLGENVAISRQRSYGMNFFGTGFSLASGIADVIDEVQINQRVTIFSRSQLVLNVLATDGVTLTNGERVKLFSIENSCFCGDSFLMPAIAVTVNFVDKDSSWKICQNTIEYENNIFYLRCDLLTENGYLTSIANVKQIIIPRIYFTA